MSKEHRGTGNVYRPASAAGHTYGQARMNPEAAGGGSGTNYRGNPPRVLRVHKPTDAVRLSPTGEAGRPRHRPRRDAHDIRGPRRDA
jgi:hypothetical protein